MTTIDTGAWTSIHNTAAATAHPERSPADVIRALEAQGFTLCKYADDMEGPREGLALDEALVIAGEDPNLIAVSRV